VRFLAALGRGLVTLVVLTVLGGLFAFAGNDWRPPWEEPPAHGEDWCEEHDVVLSTCELCNPELERGGTFSVLTREAEEDECQNRLVRITLADGAAEAVGLELHTMETRKVSERLHANAETLYPPSKHAFVAPRVTGAVREVRARLGEKVEKGTVLAMVESPAFAQAKSQYLRRLTLLEARKTRYEEEKRLFEKKFSVRARLLEVESLVSEAKLDVQESEAALAALGLLNPQIEAVATSGDVSPDVEITAPFASTVTDVSAQLGEWVGPGKPLFRVADMRRLWVSIDVYEADLAKIELGQRVIFRVDGIDRKRFRGKVVAIGGDVDERTRTVHVFAEVKNTSSMLKAHMFGNADIVIKPKEAKLVLPSEALQDDGDCHLVFVAMKDSVFVSRGVDVGAAYRQGYEILSGLSVGEKVVTQGSFLLKTEVLRGEMGAG